MCGNMSSPVHHYLLCPFGSGGDVFPFIGSAKDCVPEVIV